MKKFYEKQPQDFEYFIENTDGSVCGRVPKSWSRKFGPPAKREYTQEQKDALAERMKNMREKQTSNAEV